MIKNKGNAEDQTKKEKNKIEMIMKKESKLQV